MKKTIKLVLVIVLLGLVIGAYFFVTNHDFEADDEQVAETIVVTDYDSAFVNEFTYNFVDEKLTFVKEDGVWYYKADKSIPIIQSDVEAMVSNVTTIKATTVIDDHSDLSNYGLTEPKITISFVCDDGQNGEVYIGDYFDMDGTFFAMTKGDDNLYTVAAFYASSFEKGVEELTENTETEE